MKADVQFWRELKQQRSNMTKQQYRTIKGCGLPVATSRKARSTDRGDSRDQAVKGNIDAARKGMLRIQQRRNYR